MTVRQYGTFFSGCWARQIPGPVYCPVPTRYLRTRGYRVVSKTPLYGEIFDVDKLKQWEKDIGTIKDTLNEEDDAS